jgi:hypothetical protein
VRIEPAQLVRRTSANGIAHNRFIRLENGELFEKLFRFPESVGLLKDRISANWARYRCESDGNRVSHGASVSLWSDLIRQWGHKE